MKSLEVSLASYVFSSHVVFRNFDPAVKSNSAQELCSSGTPKPSPFRLSPLHFICMESIAACFQSFVFACFWFPTCHWDGYGVLCIAVLVEQEPLHQGFHWSIHHLRMPTPGWRDRLQCSRQCLWKGIRMAASSPTPRRAWGRSAGDRCCDAKHSNLHR